MRSKRNTYSTWFNIKRSLRALLLPFCWFSPASFLRVFFHRLRGVKIGRKVEIGYFVIIDHIYPNFIEIGNGTRIGLGTKIVAHDFLKDGITVGHDSRPKKVRIGKNIIIGLDVIILPGVTVGDRTVIGAKALVNKPVAADDIIAGIPARSIKKIVAKKH